VFGGWRRRRRAALAAELMPSPGELDRVIAHWPCLARLNAGQRESLRWLAGEILATKQFNGAGGLHPDRADCLPVAVLAAQPVLKLGIDVYRHFHTFILYPDEFEVDIEETDEAGVVHRGRDLRAGEAWHRGPVVLSLADVAESGQRNGYHVVIHELAHQLDQLNGEADGFPPLPYSIRAEHWTDTFTMAYQRLLRLIEDEHDDHALWIDEYAAESPAEFFAVASEYFFDLPETLQRHEPDVYTLLREYYRQDPLTARPMEPESGIRVH